MTTLPDIPVCTVTGLPPGASRPAATDSLAEAQRWLGVSPETFARLLCTGQLPVVHLGRKLRIADAALLDWIAAQGWVPGRREA